MIETPNSSDSLFNQTSTLNYSQALMMGLTSGHCNLQDSQQLGYSSHGNIPNIILTGAVLTNARLVCSFERIVLQIEKPFEDKPEWSVNFSSHILLTQWLSVAALWITWQLYWLRLWNNMLCCLSITHYLLALSHWKVPTHVTLKSRLWKSAAFIYCLYRKKDILKW